MPRIIGFAGLAGSGKNYAASLVQRQVFDAECFAFADPLKQCCKILFNLSDDDVYTEEGKKRLTTWPWPNCKPGVGTMTNRDILQVAGTELIRNNWTQDHWIRLMERRILSSTKKYVLVTDVRFANEAGLIRDMGGLILRMVGRKSEGIPKHASEVIDFAVDAEIVNNRGILESDLWLPIKAQITMKWRKSCQTQIQTQ